MLVRRSCRCGWCSIRGGRLLNIGGRRLASVPILKLRFAESTVSIKEIQFLFVSILAVNVVLKHLVDLELDEVVPWIVKDVLHQDLANT